MDYELHLAGLEIEITRDCNLNCPHCMRYEQMSQWMPTGVQL